MKKPTLLSAALGSLAVCGQSQVRAAVCPSVEQHDWRMVTSWPLNLPRLGASVNRLVQGIGKPSDVQLMA